MTTPTPAPEDAQQYVGPPPPFNATPAPAAGYSTPPPPTGPAEPNPWRGLTSFWVTYPVGFGLLGLAFASLMVFLGESETRVQATLAGAGLFVLALAIYAEILVGLLFLVRKVPFDAIGKLVWAVGTAVFAGVAYLACLIMGIDPWLLTISAVVVGMITVGIGQAIARHGLYGRRVPTLVCLGICVVFVVISLAMLPMSLGA